MYCNHNVLYTPIEILRNNTSPLLTDSIIVRTHVNNLVAYHQTAFQMLVQFLFSLAITLWIFNETKKNATKKEMPAL